jgi:hypothetical protein
MIWIKFAKYLKEFRKIKIEKEKEIRKAEKAAGNLFGPGHDLAHGPPGHLAESVSSLSLRPLVARAHMSSSTSRQELLPRTASLSSRPIVPLPRTLAHPPSKPNYK